MSVPTPLCDRALTADTSARSQASSVTCSGGASSNSRASRSSGSVCVATVLASSWAAACWTRNIGVRPGSAQSRMIRSAVGRCAWRSQRVHGGSAPACRSAWRRLRQPSWRVSARRTSARASSSASTTSASSALPPGSRASAALRRTATLTYVAGQLGARSPARRARSGAAPDTTSTVRRQRKPPTEAGPRPLKTSIRPAMEQPARGCGLSTKRSVGGPSDHGPRGATDAPRAMGVVVGVSSRTVRDGAGRRPRCEPSRPRTRRPRHEDESEQRVRACRRLVRALELPDQDGHG